MKKITLLYIALIGMLAFSCAKQDADPVLDLNEVVAPVASQPAASTSVVLSEENADSEITFAWSKADYKINLAVSYTVMMDFAGNDFANAFQVLNTDAATASLSYAAFNNILNANGAIPGAVANVEYYVVASVSDYADNIMSSTTSFDVTPYLAVIDYPKLYVPGSYQGWDVAKESTVIYSLKSNGKYEGYLFMDAGADPIEFKFADGPSWDVNYGDDGEDGTLDKDGANIKVAEAGMYKLNVNLNDFTYTTMLTTWGIIGDATAGGWDSDQDMSWDADNNVLTATLDLTAGEIKFRANDGWDLNYGDDGPSGYLNAGGANIVIAEAGNYTITLNLGVANYTYTIVQN